MTSVTRCSTASRQLAEPPTATASVARSWLLLEQPGPWGAKAFTASHLDPDLGRALERAAKGTGVRVALIRRTARHSDSHPPTGPRRRVFAAHVAPGSGWLREAEIDDPALLLDLDFGRLGAGEHDGFGSAYEGEPLALVCTNGKRDLCCALVGRPLAADLAASGLGQVWEITHLGGHRFAPTMLVLPYGYAYARQDTRSAKEVLDAARDGRMVAANCRGRSAWDRPGQAAELAVRHLTGEVGAEALDVAAVEPVGPDEGWTVRVTHTDGRAWAVAVVPSPGEPARPESCGRDAVEPSALAVRSIDALVSDGTGTGE